MNNLSDDEVWILTALRLGVTKPKTREEFSLVIDILDYVPVLDAVAWDVLAGDDVSYVAAGLELLTRELAYYFEHVLPDVEKWVYEKFDREPVKTEAELRDYKDLINQWVPRYKFRKIMDSILIEDFPELKQSVIEYSLKKFTPETSTDV